MWEGERTLKKTNMHSFLLTAPAFHHGRGNSCGIRVCDSIARGRREGAGKRFLFPHSFFFGALFLFAPAPAHLNQSFTHATPLQTPGRDLNARRSSSKPSPSGFSGGGASSSSLPSSSSGSSSRGSKFRALKAKEAAKKAAGQAAASPAAAAEVGGDGAAAGGTATTATGDKPVVPDAPPSKD